MGPLPKTSGQKARTAMHAHPNYAAFNGLSTTSCNQRPTTNGNDCSIVLATVRLTRSIVNPPPEPYLIEARDGGFVPSFFAFAVRKQVKQYRSKCLVYACLLSTLQWFQFDLIQHHILPPNSHLPYSLWKWLLCLKPSPLMINYNHEKQVFLFLFFLMSMLYYGKTH